MRKTRSSTRSQVKLSDDHLDVTGIPRHTTAETHCTGIQNNARSGGAVNTTSNSTSAAVLEEHPIANHENTQNVSPVKGPFRFLDLPPELRARILCLAVASKHEDGRDLDTITGPAVAAVSKQLYIETMPVLVAETIWKVTVRSNMNLHCDPSLERPPSIHAYVPGRRRSAKAKGVDLSAGKRLLSRSCMAYLRRLGKMVDCFRMINFCVYSVSYGGSAMDWLICEINVRIEHGRVLVTAAMPDMQREALYPQLRPVIDAVVVRLRSVIETAKAKQGFRGFNWGNMTELASAFDVASWMLKAS
ncbi:hypothetical protein LTR95_012901 [Oleoguttula sp. CCFEE 5521]